MLTDHHVHTPLCMHAKGEPREYCEAAIAAGLRGIGFADHNPAEAYFDDWRMARTDLPLYLAQILAVREAFRPFPVRLGLEVDFLPSHQAWIEELRGAAEWDYLIGSVHYIGGFEVDHPRSVQKYESGSVEEIWDAYWELFAQAARTKFFSFMAHPDLPKKFGFRPKGDLRRYYEPAIQALVDSGVAYEINTAGWRKAVAEAYPGFEFLQLARSAGVPVLINSDAHDPAEVGADFPRAIDLAKAAGYTEVVEFVGGIAIPVPLP